MTFLLALQGAYAIDMHFSASDGGGRTVSIWDSYDVDDSVEVYGESSACFDDLSMDDSRWIDGPGNVDVIQRYFGSGGYVGMNYSHAPNISDLCPPTKNFLIQLFAKLIREAYFKNFTRISPFI